MNDPLRDRLHDLDPMPPAVRTIADSGPRARKLLERIMATPIHQPAEPEKQARRRWTWSTRSAFAAAGLVAVVAVVAMTGVVRPGAPAVSAPPAAISLALPAGDAAGSCPIFDVAVLGQATIAFGGTVTGISNGSVELRVDQWYVGGTAATVQLEAPSADRAALDGIAFEVGGLYLVSATGNVANGCGLSGPDTPELHAAFDQAFGS